MSTQTVQSAGVAAMPRVNLMPPEIAEAARLRNLQFAMGGAVLATAVIVGGVYMHEKSGVSSAQQQVQAAQAQQASLQQKLSGLQTVAQTFSEVQQKQGLLNQALGQEIRWSYVLNDLSFKLPSNLWLNAIVASETSAGGAATSGVATTAPSTLAGASAASATTPIGSITFNVTGRHHDDIAAWLDSLTRIRGFADPAFQTSTETAIGTTPAVTAASSVNITNAALSNGSHTGSGN